ncbi:MAG: hypothetical protein ACREFJ_09860 [Acetobacteraceae bacterium]
MSAHTPLPPRHHALRLYLAFAVLGAGITLLGDVHDWPVVLHGGLIDPDSYMRLVRILQGMKAGHLTNLVRGDDSGTPLIVEWSRLLDGLLLLLAAPLAPFIGWREALFAAGVATGPLFGGLLGAALAFAARPFCSRNWLWTAVVPGLLLSGIRGFNEFGVIHYHTLQLALVALAAGFAARRAFTAAGLAAGLALWVTPETMPFVLLVFVALGWAWCFRPIGAGVARAGAALFGVVAIAVLLDPPHGGAGVVELDRVSIVYLVLAGAVAGAGIWLALLDRLQVRARMRWALGASGALCLFAVWLGLYPAVALGPAALMPAAQQHAFFGAIIEARPVRGLADAVSTLGPGIVALGYASWRCWRARGDWLAVGIWLLLAGGVGLGMALTLGWRVFQEYPAGAAAALLPVALADLSALLAARPGLGAVARVGLIAVLLVGPYVPRFVGTARATERIGRAACPLADAGRLLAPAVGEIVLTRPGEVPELLWRTRIVAVGSFYQHGVAGFLRLRAAWRAPAGARPSPAFRASGARFVLFCDTGRAHPIGFAGSRDSLWNRLAASQPPPWLRLVGQQKAARLRLYEVEERASAR